MPRFVPIAVAVGLALAGPRPVLGGATSPTLVVSSAVGAVGDGARSIAIEGTFDFDNAVQTGYALQIVVFQGTQFVRYPVAAPPRAGTSASLADGTLDVTELPALLGDGSPAPAATRIVTLTTRTARVALPPGFAAGDATVLIAAILPVDDDVVVSNPLPLVLP